MVTQGNHETRELARRIRLLEKNVLRLKQPRISYSSVDGPLVVVDDDGAVRQVVGLQKDGTVTTVDKGAPPPPKPAAPTCNGTNGSLVVTSYGNTADGSTWPSDVYRIDIHASKTVGFTPNVGTAIGNFTPGQGGTFTRTMPSALAGTYYVKLVAVNTSQVGSEPSDEVMVDVLPLDAVSQQTLEAEAAAIRAEMAAGDSANSQAIDQAVIDFNAGLATKSQHTLSPDLPGTTANNVGDVWEQHKSGDATKIIARFRGQGGTSWLPMNLDATYIPLLDIGSGTFGDLSGNRLVANSIGVDRLAVADFTNYVSDPQFKGFPGGWIYSGSGAYIDGSFPNKQGIANTGVLVLSPSGVYCDARSNLFRVQPGDSFSLTTDWLRNASANGQLYVRVYWYQESGANASTSYSDMILADSNNGQVTVYNNGVGSARAFSNGVWYTDTATSIVAPNDAAQARVIVIRSGAYTTGHWILDNMKLQRRYGGSVVIDGTLEAKHMQTDLLRSLIVRGDLLETNADPQLGIKISNSGIVGYDSQNGSPTYKQARFIVNPTTGLVTMKGGTIESSNIYGSLVSGGTFETSSASNANRVRISTASGSGTIHFYSGVSDETDAAYVVAVDLSAGGSVPEFHFVSGRATSAPNASSIVLKSGTTSANTAAILNAALTYLGSGPTSPTVEVGGTGIAQLKVWGEVHAMGGNNGIFDDYYSGGGVTNAQINNNGRMIRGSSSRALKEDIRDLTYEEAAALLDVRSVSFNWRDRENMGDRRFAGHIAEEVAEAGAELWVARDGDGNPSGVHYPEMVSGLLVLVKDALDRIADLEGMIAS